MRLVLRNRKDVDRGADSRLCELVRMTYGALIVTNSILESFERCFYNQRSIALGSSVE